MSPVESPPMTEPVGHRGGRVEITQHPTVAISGWFGVLVLAGCIWWIVVAAGDHSGWLWLPLLASALIAASLVIVTPGQTSVIQFFGRYIGTVLRPGFWWVLPLTVRRRVSVRVRNFETNRLKVNDADGNPVEIAAISTGLPSASLTFRRLVSKLRTRTLTRRRTVSGATHQNPAWITLPM